MKTHTYSNSNDSLYADIYKCTHSLGTHSHTDTHTCAANAVTVLADTFGKHAFKWIVWRSLRAATLIIEMKIPTEQLAANLTDQKSTTWTHQLIYTGPSYRWYRTINPAFFPNTNQEITIYRPLSHMEFTFLVCYNSEMTNMWPQVFRLLINIFGLKFDEMKHIYGSIRVNLTSILQ